MHMNILLMRRRTFELTAPGLRTSISVSQYLLQFSLLNLTWLNFAQRLQTSWHCRRQDIDQLKGASPLHPTKNPPSKSFPTKTGNVNHKKRRLNLTKYILRFEQEHTYATVHGGGRHIREQVKENRFLTLFSRRDKLCCSLHISLKLFVLLSSSVFLFTPLLSLLPFSSHCFVHISSFPPAFSSSLISTTFFTVSSFSQVGGGRGRHLSSGDRGWLRVRLWAR